MCSDSASGMISPVAGDLLHDHAQVVALDVLEDDEVLAVLGDPEIVDLDDVAVRERRVDARLGQQHLDEALVLREVGEDALDRDELLEAFGRDDTAFEDLGHAAHGDLLEELVLAELHEGRLTSVNRNDVPGLRVAVFSGAAGANEPEPRSR